ncbi:hypothetical protein QBC35DRAFT_449789 [Podospora australis]|uniref:Uncharacterized protein n=1 Tax=Podospora australis TaxID=1536484 RepID=A0AAN6WXD7_9PEZI|nr:hypothetical protein QBC35DRAFT_449789 [Podospora australis]
MSIDPDKYCTPFIKGNEPPSEANKKVPLFLYGWTMHPEKCVRIGRPGGNARSTCIPGTDYWEAGKPRPVEGVLFIPDEPEHLLAVEWFEALGDFQRREVPVVLSTRAEHETVLGSNYRALARIWIAPRQVRQTVVSYEFFAYRDFDQDVIPNVFKLLEPQLPPAVEGEVETAPEPPPAVENKAGTAPELPPAVESEVGTAPEVAATSGYDWQVIAHELEESCMFGSHVFGVYHMMEEYVTKTERESESFAKWKASTLKYRLVPVLWSDINYHPEPTDP